MSEGLRTANSDLNHTKYQVEIPDIEYYQRAIKCQAACPVGTDAYGYVTAIARGDLVAGYAMARGPNPLASVCGRVCNAPCEAACRRGSHDSPLAIRSLKRVLTERYGVESGLQTSVTPSQYSHVGAITARDRTTLEKLAAQPRRKTGRVAVIGSGPAGLAVAHDLAILGHEVTIFEAAEASGGMLRLGIPLYRLSRTLLDREVAAITNLGVDLRLNTPVDPSNIMLAELRRDYDAVFIGAGLGKGRDLRIPGVELDGVLKAVDFLLNVNMGYRVNLGQRVIIIGGGDVAIDAARMAMRARLAEADLETLATAGKEAEEAIHTAFDAARTAIRMGAIEVRMVALEDWHELPASQHELEEALEEGIEFHTRLGPNRILGENGKVTGLETIAVGSVFDEQGRFSPTFIPDTEAVMRCDTVIMAIGQAADLGLLAGHDDIKVSPRGLIVADEKTGATTAAGVYAGGDVVYGPRILIEAVRDGQHSARAIDGYIQGREVVSVTHGYFTILPDHQMPADWIKLSREIVPTRPLDRRIGIAEVETGYDQEQALRQAKRCLQCGVNTVFDAEKCILCGACVDVCPWNCLKIVSVAELAALNGQADELTLAVEHQFEDGASGAAMIKDEELCTRCALCAQRCPVGAITMEHFTFEETLQYSEQ